MTPNRDWLVDVKEHEVSQIEVANKTTILVKGSGRMDIKTLVDGRSFDVTIKEVLCVPQLSANLLSSGLGEPTTIEDALNGDDSVQWKRAIEDELQSFEENQAWVVADLPEGATCVQNKWVFKKKVDSAGGVKFN
ncbi:hypothetical protein QE152_g40027 [Popillia japonica]|uniref:Retrovirus-related Pol polyprotein from transposon TNT 1-94-like beta-barrel domain-containing protein n=1 Tax=Popillia japonica TaxID=7064 RepID=A0AAW1HT41_POPJA